MAPKRFKKSDRNEENYDKYKNLVISDVLCPICRSILIEPVTLPCNHGFCLACFNGTMENTTLTCPLCRVRIGSWLRSARKENKIINGVLWRVIQLQFSKEISKKLEGDDITTEEKVSIKLADPGEIRREYEIELQKERSEVQKLREAEDKASEIVIKKLLEEEQNAAKVEEEKLRLDEEVARRLAVEEPKSGPSCSQSSSKPTPKKSSLDRYLIALNKKKSETEVRKTVPAETIVSNKGKSTAVAESSKCSTSKAYTSTIMCQTRDKQQCSKAYKHLLLTKTLQCERANSNGSDSGDSIKQEMRYFKPIRSAPKSMPKLQGDGNIVRVPLIKVPSVYARSVSSAVIRSPTKNMTVRIGPHSNSAFVGCGANIAQEVTVSPVKQPSIVSESGRVIKQYYNKKRNVVYVPAPPSTVTSPILSPLLGFEQENEQRKIGIMNDLVNSLSENVNGILSRSVPSNAKCVDVKPVEKKPERSPEKLNGFDSNVLNLKSDFTLQERLDLEYAKRLHEELNNPRSRQTRASVQSKKPAVKPMVKTRSSPRKRQVTLDELIPPKKFKI